LVLEDTVERVFHGQTYSDVRPRDPVFLVRGENVVLIGEIVRLPIEAKYPHFYADIDEQDLDVEDDVPLQQVPYKGHMDKVHKDDFETKKRRDAAKAAVLHEQKGFTREGGEGDWY
jgi:U6 snRNA-associated Sm-like protein LSm1